MGVVSRKWMWVESKCVVVRRYIECVIVYLARDIPAFVI